MLSEEQRRRTRAALYGPSAAADASLPVAPLSIAERAVGELLARNARLGIFMLGGDHSVAWPVVAALARHVSEPWAIVHVDAHTDLLPERLGVRLCFATWAYHANELLGRGGRLVQVGVRASSRSKQHWESTLGVRQFWADEVRARGDGVIDDVIAHLRGLGVARVYFSNDIDATDSAAAPSTGAPEANGLAPGVRAGADRARRGSVPSAGRRRGRGRAVDRQRRGCAAHDGRCRRVYACDAGGDDGRGRTFATPTVTASGRKATTMVRAPKTTSRSRGMARRRSARRGMHSTRASWRRRGTVPSGWARTRPRPCSCARHAAARRMTSTARSRSSSGRSPRIRSGRRPSSRSRSCSPRRPTGCPTRASTRRARSSWPRKRMSICRRWR